MAGLHRAKAEIANEIRVVDGFPVWINGNLGMEQLAEKINKEQPPWETDWNPYNYYPFSQFNALVKLTWAGENKERLYLVKFPVPKGYERDNLPK